MFPISVTLVVIIDDIGDMTTRADNRIHRETHRINDTRRKESKSYTAGESTLFPPLYLSTHTSLTNTCRMLIRAVISTHKYKQQTTWAVWKWLSSACNFHWLNFCILLPQEYFIHSTYIVCTEWRSSFVCFPCSVMDRHHCAGYCNNSCSSGTFQRKTVNCTLFCLCHQI